MRPLSCRALTFAAVMLATLARADEPPRIVRLRVPSDRVKTLFPAGTELRVMPREEFEALAGAATRRADLASVPVILRARHEARLDGDRLVGRSEVSWNGSGDPEAIVTLHPWTPAIEGVGGTAELVRVGPEGRLGLSAAGTGPRGASLAWEQRARPGTEGRTFDLGLPATAACRLTLDLPEGLVPELAGTIRQGPEMGPSTDRRTWRLDGPGGLRRLRLRAAGAAGDPSPPIWIAGTTRVDVSELPARWSLDAVVDPGASGPRRFDIELDPGLDLIDVVGAGVASYRAEPSRVGGTTVTVRLGDSLSGPSAVTIRALCREVPEGRWPIPAYRSRGAVWTGDRTLVRLGPGLVASGIRPLGGRQVEPTVGEREFGRSRSGLLLAFESSSPGSAAEIALARSPINASADVRGQVVLGPIDAPRLEARITWRVDRGRLPSLSADLPSGWSPEKAQILGVAEATAWHAESRPGGGSRLVVHTPAGGVAGAAIVLDLTATASSRARPLGLELPRVTPVGARVTDEVWTLRADPRVKVVPRQARGLAWIDPATIDPLNSAVARLFATKPILAWRWTTGDGQAIVGISPSAPTAAVEAWTVAIVQGDRLTLEYNLAIDSRDRPPTELTVAFLGDSSGTPVRWEFPAEPSREVEAAPIVAGERDRLNFPAAGLAWRIVVPRRGRDRLVLRARVQRPWTGSGALPLLVLPDGDLARGTLLVFADRSLAAKVDAPGLSTRDAAWAGSTYLQVAGLAPEGDAAHPRARPTLAFGYNATSAPPMLRTEPLPPAATGGVVEEARLASRPSPDSRTLHRLALRIVPGPDRVIEIALPGDAIAERVEVEGRDASPTRVSGRLRFLLPAPTPARPTVELEIDYLGAEAGGDSPARPELPRVSLPCLAFSWGLQLPADLAVGTVQGGLAPTGSTAGIGAKTTAADRAAIREMDERCRRIPPDGLSLSSWLTRLDAGRTPIVVDRHGLEVAGWGPRTPLVAPRDRPRSSPASETFASLGLSVGARGGVVVVGAGAMATDLSEEAVNLAATTGQDEVDRLQSVARWRGESTPGPVGDRPRRSAGETSAGFASAGWPSPIAAIRLVDPASRRVVPVVIAAAIALASLALRRSSIRLRAAGLGLVLGVGFAWGHVAHGVSPEVGPGLIWGGCAGIGIVLGAALRPEKRPPRRGGSHSRWSRARGAGTVAAVLVASFSQAPARQVPESVLARADSETIFAVLPYDSPFDPSQGAPRVILRLADHDRLRARADALAAPRLSEPFLTAALHEVHREGPRDARVSSTFDLRADGLGARSWSVPIAGGRDVSATLDGRDVPVRVGSSGATGTVDLPEPGTHRLILRRLVAVIRSAEGESLRVPVPPIATARLRVDEPAGGPSAEAPSSRGRCSAQNGVFEGTLGPVDELELCWPGPAATGPPAPKGTAEGAVLWDVEPAGDRVRLKITARPGEPLDRLALELGPGLLVRSVDRPGAADAAQRVVTTGTVWSIPLSPPLLTGQSVTLELWRPLEVGPDALVRRLPRIQSSSLKEFSGLVGVRRPESWSGRLGPGDGGEPVPDDLFARAWGPFPDATATFAGAARFVGVPQLILRAGPSRERPRIRPSVTLDLAPGRIDVRAEAELSDDGGWPRELEATIPPDLRLTRIEAPGLTDWSRPADDRIRLRFDGDPSPMARTIRIVGWVPIDGDPMAIGATRSEADAPWPSWIAADVLPGALEITAPSHVAFRLEPQPGVRPTVPATAAPDTSRTGFLVPPGSAPGRLRWTAEANGVSVRVQSLLTLHPETADWVASARYSVAWGPCPPIKLRLPPEWAEMATAEVDGVPIVPDVDPQGVGVSWTLRPDRPAWGGARVVIRASRPRRGVTPLAFPDLVPLGRPQMDRADSYLAYADASGMPTVVDGSAELQAVDASRWDADDLPWPPGTARNVFRVVKEGWSLRFLAPAPPRASSEGAGVSLAELECSITAEGILIGRASYNLDGRPAATLVLTLPQGAEPLAAAVDGAAVLPRRDAGGRIVIPLPDGSSTRVVLSWRDRVDASRAGTIPLPNPTGQAVPTLLSVSAPERSRFAVSGMTAAISAAEAEATCVDLRARLLTDRLTSFDRGSPRDRATLLAALIRFELQVRAADRAAIGSKSSAKLSVLQSGRRALEEALSASGLDDFARSAAARVGLVESDPLATQPGTFEGPAPLRLRRIGSAFAFRDASGPPAIRWSLRPPDRLPLGTWLPPATSVVLLLVASAFGPGRPRRAAVALALAGGLAAMGPGLGIAAALTLVGGVAVGLMRG